MNPTARGVSDCVIFAGALAAIAAGVAVLLILLLRPLLLRHALARPSVRGLHTTPTPQGGGIAVLSACILVASLAAAWLGIDAADRLRLIAVLVAAALLAVLGFSDDVRPLPPLPRLVVQLFAMVIGVIALPEGTRICPMVPLALERATLVLAGTWFINLTNFMDGMDWMTVVEMVPVSGVLVLVWCLGGMTVVPGLIAIGLLGGMAGYAPFNKPVAQLFLGDVGSLPIGLLVAYGLFSLAGHDGSMQLATALLPCLYYVADSGITLAWRLWHRQRVWEPHRIHFYQVAVGRGLTAWQVIARVSLTNGVLAALALASLGRDWSGQAIALALGSGAVALLLASLSRSVR